MEVRPYSKSLRGKITNRTLFIGIAPVLMVGIFSWFSLNQLTTSANEQLDNSRAELLDSVVGNNLSTTSARIVNQLDTFMLERISDVVVWASAPIILQAAKSAAAAHQKAGLVDKEIDEIEALFKTRKSLNISPTANRYLIQQIRRSSHFGEVFFTDKHGFNTALTNPTSDFVQRDENWWKTAWENGISVGEVEFDDSAGIWSIMKAVLGVSLIQEVADKGARDINGGLVTVISSGGLLLAETGTKHAKDRIMIDSVNLRNSTDPALQEVFSARNKGYVLSSDQVLGYAKSAGPELYRTVVTRFPGFNWSVLVQQPTSIALAPIEGLSTVQASLQTSKRQVIVILSVVVLAVFALAFFIAGMLSKAITQPMLDLRELADSVSKGDTSRTISVNSDDEIQDVAQAFERMRTSVSIIMKRITYWPAVSD
jgi:HAMP domain-containing protein